jgi:hypothetical protein
MKSHLSILKVFLIVTLAALTGMLLGGLFGLSAGKIAPDLFRTAFPWRDVEPVGAATVLGAFGGVVCGGGLGVFAVIAQLMGDLCVRSRNENK